MQIALEELEPEEGLLESEAGDTKAGRTEKQGCDLSCDLYTMTMRVCPVWDSAPADKDRQGQAEGSWKHMRPRHAGKKDCRCRPAKWRKAGNHR